VLPPPDPAAALAKAAAALPTLAEIGAAPAPVLPTATVPPPVAKPEPPPALPTATVAPPVAAPEKPAPVARPEPAAKPEPAQAAPPPAAKPPATDVVIVDPPAKAAPAAEPEGIVVGSNQTENAFNRKLAAQRGTSAENPRTAARPAPPARSATAPGAARTPADGARQPAPAEYLHPQVAERTLSDARWLAREGLVDDACDVYERLRLSPLAKVALLEEVRLLNRQQRPRDALKLTAAASPELVSDALRLELGKAMLATGRPGDALGVLSEVNGDAPESREALLLIGRAYAAEGKPTQARRVFEHLAKGDDDVADSARAALRGGDLSN
jgi:hypothetical protein